LIAAVELRPSVTAAATLFVLAPLHAETKQTPRARAERNFKFGFAELISGFARRVGFDGQKLSTVPEWEITKVARKIPASSESHPFAGIQVY
jgi:hypothetical protein